MAYAATILADSPVRYYRLGDTLNSTSAVDSSVSNQAGTVNNIADVIYGQTGALSGDADTAAQFDGAGYIAVPQTGLPTGNAAFTLEGWFKTSATGVYQMIINMGANSTHQAGQLYINNTNQLVGDLNNARITSTSTYTDGKWHYASFTWDGTNAVLYCDGFQVAASSSLGVNNLTQSVVASIGNQQSFGGNFFNGLLDEAAIYPSALTSAQIYTHYAAGAPVVPSALSFAAIEALTIPAATPVALSGAYIEQMFLPTVTPRALSSAYIEVLSSNGPYFTGWGVPL